MIKCNEPLPHCELWEFARTDGADVLVPVLQPVQIDVSCKDKVIAIFGIPGAFTIVCSNEHVPGYLELASHFKSIGVDEIWCVSVNDAYVLRAWAEQLGIEGRIRMLSDGNAEFANALGLQRDLSNKGMGVRLQRFSMLVVNGVVKVLNIEPEGKFVISDAQQLYIQAQGMLDSIINSVHN